MLTLDTAIAALIVLGAAVVTGRWIWRSLNPPPGESTCSSCGAAEGACSTCSLPAHHRED